MTENILHREPPALSAIIVIPGEFDSTRRLVRYLQQQTICDQLELVMVLPKKSTMTLGPELLAAFWGYQVIETGPFQTINQARAVGIRQAKAPVVVLTEDHCFPIPGWAEALVNAHRQPWAAVGPSFGLMNQHSYPVWAMFFLQYGRWIKPTPSGVMSDIAGHNSSYKKEILLSYGAELEKILEFEYALHQDLQRRGYQLYLESAAETFHVFIADRRTSLEANYVVGRLLAGTRANYLPKWKALLYCLTTPLLPPLRTYRVVKRIYSLGWQNKLLPGILPWLILYLLVTTWGEFNGYLFGIGYAQQKTLEFEARRQNFVTDQEKQRIWGETLIDLASLPTQPQVQHSS